MNPSTGIPLVFFHKGYDPHLVFFLTQAVRTNPSAPVYLLGDDSNRLELPGVEHVCFRDYPGQVDAFLERYQHLSSHDLHFERSCFERHFHVAAFVAARGLQSFFYMDSDMLLLTDLTRLARAWPDHDIAGTPGLFGLCHHARPEILHSFCRFILERFSDAEQLKGWRARFQTQRQGESHGNVNDMVLSAMFLRESGIRTMDLREVRNGFAFNDSIWIGNEVMIPLARGPADQGLYAKTPAGWIRLAALHLQGFSPKFLVSAFVPWSRPIVRFFLRPNYRRNLRKMIRHWLAGRRFAQRLPTLSAQELQNHP